MSKSGLRRICIWGVGLLAVLIGLQICCSLLLRSLVVKKIHELGGSAKVQLGTVEMPVFAPGRMIFSQIHIDHQMSPSLHLALRLPSLQIDVSLRAILQGELIVDEVLVDAPSVVITDTSQPPPPAESLQPFAVDFKIGEVRVRQGRLIYIAKDEHETAQIQIHQIDGVIRDLQNRSGEKPFLATVEAEALIESSGHLHLAIEAYPFHRPLDAKIKADLHDFDLAELSRFFEPNDGVVLAGVVRSAHTSISMRGGQEQVVLTGRYENLKVKVLANKDRSGFSAFFTNLATGLSMNKNNLSKPPVTVKPVTLEQKPQESLVHFVLRGIKEASIEVATE